jgi:hypothetical protein
VSLACLYPGEFQGDKKHSTQSREEVESNRLEEAFYPDLHMARHPTWININTEKHLHFSRMILLSRV